MAGTESYQQDAIEYAAQVLNARNLPTERRSDLETIARSTAAKKEAYRQEGLGAFGKAVSFLGGLSVFGFVLIFAAAGIRYRLHGRTGKIEDMWRYYFRGLTIPLALGMIQLVLVLIAYFARH